MKKLLLIGSVVLVLALAAGLAKQRKLAQAASVQPVAARSAQTNAAALAPAPAQFNPAVTCAPAPTRQEVAELYKKVISDLEDAFKNNK